MDPIKKVIKSCIWVTGKTISFLFPFHLARKLKLVRTKLYSVWISGEFKSFGRMSHVQPGISLLGGRYISIGNNTCIGLRVALTAWDKFESGSFSPEIIIGDNVSIGDDSHITAINRIEIGNNVLTGKKITITDNSHGKIDIQSLSAAPIHRPLYSPGPVIIGENVWIGDKVTILPNVRIGRNAIIGANAVVTKDIPANCVAAGIPARVINMIKEHPEKHE